MLTIDRAARRLGRSLARRCHGRTMVLSRGDDIAQMIRDEGGDVTEICRDLQERTSTFDAFHTVMLVDTIEHLPSPERECLLQSAWRIVRPGGRLVVSVPNREAADKDDDRGMRRRDLRSLLRPLGEPKLAHDQPFRWLTMTVGKPGRNGPRLPRTRLDRYRVTARLCRGEVIELGCGEGHLTKLVHDRGHRAAGVDLSVKKTRTARELYPAIPFARVDIRAVPLRDASFDTAILAEVLEHVPEAHGAEMLAEAWRLLRPGGRLIVSVPNEDCIPHPHHVREFKRSDLRRLLQPLGRTKLVTDQPYQWLMMYVEKSS